MTFQEFNHLAGGVQSLLLSLAVLTGGAWALFRFFSLKEVRKATAELEKLKRELLQQGHLKLDMKATQMSSADHEQQYIAVNLVISNVGNRTEVIRWKESKFSAAPVILGENGQVQLGEQTWSQALSMHVDLLASTIDPGVSDTGAFLIPVKSYGVYFLEASLAGSPAETLAAFERVSLAGLEHGDKAYWNAQMYFNVVEPSDELPAPSGASD